MIVRVVDEQPGLHGIVLIGDGRALIRITKASTAVMSEVALEEWAHILRHEVPIPVEDEHDAIFWAILGEITKKWRGE